MNIGTFLKQLSFAFLLGILTILCCLILADGIIGMDAWYFYARDLVILPGRIVFWIFIIGLPVVFSKWTRPVYTLINLPLFYSLYFPVKACFDHVDIYWHEDRRSLFMYKGGFDFFPVEFNACMMAVVFFAIEFIVLIIACRKRLHGGKVK